jgi:peroxiredoxin
MKASHDILGEIEATGTHILGISVNSTTSHRACKEQLCITWDLLSDVSGSVSSLYGC